MKGSVGRAFAKAKRYKEDKVFKEKCQEINKKYRKNNKEKTRLGWIKWVKKLNEFRNRKCKECGKLLNYKTKGDYCNEHFQWKWRDKILK